MSEVVTLNIGLNGTSLGNISWSICRELFSRGIKTNIFPIGQVDAAAQKPDEEFFKWVREGIDRASLEHSRKNPIIKNWHLNGSLESFSDRQILLTYFETSAPTPWELNIVRNNHKVFIPSKYAVERFKSAGAANVDHIDLFFDSTHFKVQPQNRAGNRTEWMCAGKYEHRKRTAKTIQAWLKKYGNNPAHCLNLSINNNFIKPEVFQQIIGQVLGQIRWWNVNFIPWTPNNLDFNQVMNFSDIFIAMSGGESNDTLNMHAAALGKHIICMNAHGYLDWADEKNAVLIDPAGKIPINDQMFFQDGQPFSQGDFFDYAEDDLFKGFKLAEQRLSTNKVNEEGLKLQSRFTIQKTVDLLLSHI